LIKASNQACKFKNLISLINPAAKKIITSSLIF